MRQITQRISSSPALLAAQLHRLLHLVLGILLLRVLQGMQVLAFQILRAQLVIQLSRLPGPLDSEGEHCGPRLVEGSR
jgi:hypothetical protein